jgi:hypothetical protein
VARALFRGAPELSRLFVDSPIQLIGEFLSHSQFSVILSDAMAAVSADAEDQICTEKMADALKALKSDRINLIEIEARRVMLMTDKTPDATARRRSAVRCEGRVEGAARRGRQKPLGLPPCHSTVRSR